MLYVFSKIDAVPDAEMVALRERSGNLLSNSSVFVSSFAAQGRTVAQIVVSASKKRN